MEENKDTPFAKLREYEGTHVCARCGANLVTIWDEQDAIYKLVCAKDRAHVGVRKIESNTTLLKRGELDKEHRAGTQASLEKSATEGGNIYSLAATKDVANGQLITARQWDALIAFAGSVSLKALLGHVCLYFGEPYVTIDGYYYLKNARGMNFAVITTPMTSEERKAYQVVEGSHAFIARAISLGGDERARGLGIITPEEMNEKSRKNPEHFAAPIVHDKPQRMAEKRAEWQLLKKMVSLGAEVPAPAPEPKVTIEKTEQAKKDAEILWGKENEN